MNDAASNGRSIRFKTAETMSDTIISVSGAFACETVWASAIISSGLETPMNRTSAKGSWTPIVSTSEEQPDRRDGRAAVKRALHPGRVGLAARELLAFAQSLERAAVAERRGLLPEEEVNEQARVHVDHEGANEQAEEQADRGNLAAEQPDHRGERREEPKEVTGVNEQSDA